MAGAGGSRAGVLAGLGLLVLGLGILSVAIGSVPIPPADLVASVTGDRLPTVALIVEEIRLPRTLLAALVGASLGLAGAALQGYLRNPLAEPGLVGVSAGAAFGAVLALYSGIADRFAPALPLSGMAGALVATMAVFLLAGVRTGALSLILAGVAINSLAAALTSLVLNFAPSPYAALEIVFWMLGSLADRSFEHVRLAAPVMAVGWVLIWSTARALDALSLGEDAARSMGVNLARLRVRMVMGTALAVGAAVSVSGVIGFVGLVVPHLLRPLLGHQPGRLLGASFLGGAALTTAADIIVRLLPQNGPELKLGVVTALIGAPFFLVLVLRTRARLI